MVMAMMMMMMLLLVMVASASSVRTVKCRPEEHDALLSFAMGVSISDQLNPGGYCECGYALDPRTRIMVIETWDKNGDCCEWVGVTCNPRTSHVVGLELNCNLLNGSLSNTSLIHLPHLRNLDLSCNYLYGQVPPEIGRLSHLNSLDLSNNIQLKMPNFPTIIANLTNLNYLALSNVVIESHLPPQILYFSKLQTLFLENCGLEGEFPVADLNRSIDSILPSVTDIDLSYNKLSGTIPGWLFTRTTLSTLTLNDNSFTGLAEFEGGSGSLLADFNARYNQIQGEIPYNIFELQNLRTLDIRGNNLTGTIPLSRILKLSGVYILVLSDNSLSIIDDMEAADREDSWPTFEVLSLSSCNLSHFPTFLKDQKVISTLEQLELSNNGIHGEIPDWLSELGNIHYLNLSHNLLEGGLQYIPWQSVIEIDIQYNLFHGAVPVPIQFSETYHFWASNNKFTGAIPPSLCNLTSLSLLDLAQNHLTGSIPECLVSSNSQLAVLDLTQNQLHGEIPSSLFQSCNELQVLSLSGNKLEGQIPQAISNCPNLQLLDLSNNNISDNFPYWLGSLPVLRVLTLASNKLHGSLMASNTTTSKSSFPVLQIIDISNNEFTGNLPVDMLMSMKATHEVDYMLYMPYLSYITEYRYSIVTSIKGNRRRLDQIYNEVALIDVSRNKLEGSIPDAIGDLVTLRELNLAHNHFTGHIPPSLSNLSLLESLDLSSNRLEGRIPTELVNLISLAFFNVSDNDLVGPVPTGKQFDTFSDPSYLGNPRLCGPLLTNKCGKAGDAPLNSSTSKGSIDESSGLQVWHTVLMGCGSGLIAGLAWGYFIFWQSTPIWVQRLILQIEALVALHQRRRHQNKRRGAKKHDT